MSRARGFAREPIEPEIEASIVERAGEDEPYLVYADWLEQRGHPRGRWISLHHALSSEPSYELSLELETLREAHAARFVPAMDETIDPRPFRWRNGFIEAARLFKESSRTPLSTRLRSLFTHPSMRFVRGLVLVYPRTKGRVHDVDEALEALAGAPRTVDALAVCHSGPAWYSGYDDVALRRGDRLWELVPNIRRLTLEIQSLELGTIVAPRLEHLTLRGGSLRGTAALSLGAADLPSLKTLHVEILGPASDLEFLKTLKAPSLEDLSLSRAGGAILRDTFERLAAWPGFAKLKRLQLENPSANDGSFDGGFLRELESGWGHLEEIRLVPTRFGHFSRLEGVEPFRILHPIRSEREPDLLDTLCS